MVRASLPLLVGLIATLPGCAGKGEYPSLAPRAIEQAASAPEVAPPVAAPSDAELARQIAAILAAADSGHRQFADELVRVRPVVAGANGATPGSERWVAAQQAYSRAETARGPLLSALADLDALRRSRIDAAAPADRAALDQAAERLRVLEAEEASALSDLAARIG
jgi:hypothetical protein